MKPLIFDIETQPLPDEQLRPFCPPVDESEFEIGEFDPASVKTGNMSQPSTHQAKIEQHEMELKTLRDGCSGNLDDIKKEVSRLEKAIAAATVKQGAAQAAIDAKIDQAREQHEAKKEGQSAEIEAAKREAFEKFRSAATLNAAYSCVLCCGFFSNEKGKFAYDAIGRKGQTEAGLLDGIWSKFVKAVNDNRMIVGVNIFDFDLPYMFRRSVVNNVQVPGLLFRDRTSKWPKWHDCFVDIGKVWCATTHPSQCKWGFETLAHAFGTAGKFTDGEIKGGDFHKFWIGTARERSLALGYLKADVMQPAEWAERMGL